MKITRTKPEGIILSAVRQYVDFLAPTYGPTGKKTLIVESEFAHKAVDDGRMTSQAFEITNELENAVIQYIKETTEKTYQRVKDGTTTAAILMAAIVEEVYKDLDNQLVDTDYHAITLALKKGLDEAVAKIEKGGKKIKTKEELYAIALNSFNDAGVAKLIADTVHEIGKDGVISIEDSQSVETTVEIVQGLEMNKGYASPYLINTPDNHVVLKNPYILLVNKRVETFGELVPLFKQLQGQARQIVIFAEGFGEGFINSTISQKFISQGNFNPLLVETPGFGIAKLENLNDLAIITGAKIVDDRTQVTLEKLTVDQLGGAESVDASKDKTVVLGGKKADLKAYVESLKTPTTNKFDQDRLDKRIAALLGGVAVIKVGGYTENEQKWAKAKIENAFNATQLAFKAGVTAGGGLTYAEIETSSPILNVALKAPRKQLEANGKAYLDKNVIDPTSVLIAGLETAVSIASGLITLGGISVVKRKMDKDGNYI